MNLRVALNLAASIGGVAVGVIAEDLQDGNVTCDTVVDGTGQFVTINRWRPGEHGRRAPPRPLPTGRPSRRRRVPPLPD